MMIKSAKKLINFLLIIAVYAGQLSAMEEVAFDQHKDQQKSRPEHVRFERPLSFFEKLEIALSPTNSKELPLAFQELPGMYIIDYNLDGKPLGQLIQTAEAISFTSHYPQKYDFLVQTPIKTCKLIVNALGRFVFEKPVETDSAVLSSKTMAFLETFSNKNNISIEASNCDNSKSISCTDFLFKGDLFNCMPESKLTIEKALKLLAKQGLFNYGQISGAENALINTPLFENWGTLDLGNLVFENGSILNEGSIQLKNLYSASAQDIDHRGKLRVENDCNFKNITNITTTRPSSWHIGNNWRSEVKKLYLAGNTLIGTLSLFNVACHATLSGTFRSPILHVESNNLITCDFPARLIASRYIGLKAKGWIECQGDVFKTFVHEANKTKKLDESLCAIFPQGVFLHSAQSGIKKSGTILSRNGTVRFDAQKGLVHNGLTDAGVAPDALILMNAASLNLEKDSVLKSLNAALKAQENLKQQGKAIIEQQLSYQALEIVHSGSSESGTFFARANKITAPSTSQITAKEDASLVAEETIDNDGPIAVGKQLTMESGNISLGPNSHVQAENASLNAREKLENKGSLHTAAELLARAKYLENEGDITAFNAHLKADRWWWNKWGGMVRAEKLLRIDALLALNTLALQQANDLTINAGADLNFLSVYHAKNTNINALVSLNAGLVVPKFDSVEDVFTVTNVWRAGESLLSAAAPQTGLFLGALKSGYALYSHGSEFIKNAKELYHLENAGVSDWIPVICSAKNFATTTYQTGKMISENWNQQKSSDADTTSNQPNQDSQTPTPQPPAPNNQEAEIPNQTNWSDIAKQAGSISMQTASNLAAAFGPQVNRDTLIDLNFGAQLGVNGSTRAIWSVNNGVYAFANGYSLNTRYGSNRGFMGAANLNIQASRNYSNNRVLAAHRASIQTNTFQGSEGAKIHATQTHLKTKELDNKGTTDGQLAVEFDGEVKDLKSIGKVDQVHYKGPLAEGLADTLVQGNNDLLKVKPSGSVGIDTENDAHLKEAHNVPHGIQIRTKGNLTTDESLKSGGSVGLYADKNIDHKDVDAAKTVDMSAGGKVTAHSEVALTSDGANYDEKLNPVTVKAGDAVHVTAQGDIDHEAVQVQSGKGGTHLKAGKKIIAGAKTTEKHTESSKTNKKGSRAYTKKETSTKSHASKYRSKGSVTMEAGDTCELMGTTFNAGEAPKIHGKNGVHGHPVHDTLHQEVNYTKDGGWFRTSKTAHKETISQTAGGVDFKGKSTPDISSEGTISMPFTSDSEKVVLNAPYVEITVVQNTSVSVSQSAKNNIAWESQGCQQKQEVTYAPTYKGVIETNAQSMHVHEVKDRAPLNIDAKKQGIHITKTLFTEIHNHQKQSAQGPTRAAMMVITLAVTLATSGVGSSLGAGIATSVGIKSGIGTAAITNIVSATGTSFATQATEQLLRCDGDPLAAAKKIASLDTFKKVVLSAVTAGATSCVNGAITQVIPSVSEGTNIAEKLAYAAPRQVATAAIRTAASAVAGNDVKEAIIQNARSAVADTIGVAGASQIGDMYHNGTINPVTHKALHTANGALSGAIMNGAPGAAAGATGALVAETVADAFSSKKPSIDRMRALEEKLGRQLTQEEFVTSWNNQAREYMQQAATHADISKLAAAGVAFLTRQDVGIAQHAGATAVDNNFLGLIGMGFVAGSAAYSAYNVYTAYQDEGAVGAAKQLGIEVVTEVAGVVTGAVIGEVAGKVGYKFGTKVYPTIKDAIDAALDAQPGLKIALGKFSNTLITGAEKLGNTAIGKGLKKADEWALKQTAKISTAVENHLSELGEDLAAAHVPGSVAAKMESRAAANEIAQATSNAVPSRLRPLGLGSTGRTEAAGLHEQLVLEEVMSDPYIGKEIEKVPMTDPRWPQINGWRKMTFHNKEFDIEVHYVAQYKNNTIMAIDDFKFKKEPRY